MRSAPGAGLNLRAAVLAAAAGIFAYNAGGPVAYTLLYLVAGTGLLALLWAVLARFGLQVEGVAVSAASLSVGERVAVEVRLRNRAPWPTPPVRVSLAASLPAETEPVCVLPPLGRATLRLEAVARQRGTLRLGPVRVRIADPLGIACVERLCAPELAVRVYPRLYRPGLALALMQGEEGEAKVRVFRGEELREPVGVRPWRPGDAGRLVDWKATARRGSLHVREMAPPTARRVLVAVELCHRVLGEGSAEREERLVSLAASMARDLVRAGLSVGVVLSGQRPAYLPPEQGPRAWLRALEAFTDAASGPATLGEALRGLGAGSGERLVVVAPELEPGLAALAARFAAVQVLLPAGALPPPQEAAALQARGIRVAAAPPEPEAGPAPLPHRSGRALPAAARAALRGSLALAACAGALWPWRLLLEGAAPPAPLRLTAALAAAGLACGLVALRLPGWGKALLAAAAGLTAWRHGDLVREAAAYAVSLWRGAAQPGTGGSAGLLLSAGLALALGFVAADALRQGQRWEMAVPALAAGFAVRWAFGLPAEPLLPFLLGTYAAWAAAVSLPPRGRWLPPLLAGTALAGAALGLTLALPRDLPGHPWTWLQEAAVRVLPFAGRTTVGFGGFGSRAGGAWNPHPLGGSFVPDTRVLLRVTVEGEKLPAQLYLRGVAYTVYTGSAWRRRPVPASEPPLPEFTRLVRDGDPLSLRVTVEPRILVTDVLYAPWVPAAVEVPGGFRWDADLNLAATRPMGRGQEYRVAALLPTPTLEEVQGEEGPGRRFPLPARLRAPDNPYLQLPRLPDRVRALARQVTAGARDPLEAALAIERYLRTLRYSTEFPELPAERDFVDFFLFDQRAGYCTGFASAMAVMLREVGIPSRYVEGFVLTLQGPGTYEVTGRNAHTWVEAYLPGYGWMAFEPTPAYAPSEVPPRAPASVPVPGQGEAGAGDLPPLPPLPEMEGLGEGGPGEAGTLPPAARLPWERAALALAAAAGLAWLAGRSWSAWRYRRSAALPAGPKRIRAAYARTREALERALAAAGLLRPEVLGALTPAEFLARASAAWPEVGPPLERLTRWYQQAAYAGRAPELSAGRVEDAYRQVHRALREALGPWGLRLLVLRAAMGARWGRRRVPAQGSRSP